MPPAARSRSSRRAGIARRTCCPPGRAGRRGEAQAWRRPLRRRRPRRLRAEGRTVSSRAVEDRNSRQQPDAVHGASIGLPLPMSRVRLEWMASALLMPLALATLAALAACAPAPDARDELYGPVRRGLGGQARREPAIRDERRRSQPERRTGGHEPRGDRAQGGTAPRRAEALRGNRRLRARCGGPDQRADVRAPASEQRAGLRVRRLPDAAQRGLRLPHGVRPDASADAVPDTRPLQRLHRQDAGDPGLLRASSRVTCARESSAASPCRE